MTHVHSVCERSAIFIPIGAIHRYYESRRRLFNDSRPGRRESAQRSKHNARRVEKKGNKVYASWPHSVVDVCASSQLYNSRKYPKTEKEERRGGDLDWRFMMNEGSGSEGSLHQHPLPWHSKGERYWLFAEMRIALFMVATLCVPFTTLRIHWQLSQLAFHSVALMSVVLLQTQTCVQAHFN